jgi:hypothetical protein
VTVSPGKGGVGTFSPPLDEAGNSVRGQRITRYLSEALGLNLFASAPLGLLPTQLVGRLSGAWLSETVGNIRRRSQRALF